MNGNDIRLAALPIQDKVVEFKRRRRQLEKMAGIGRGNCLN